MTAARQCPARIEEEWDWGDLVEARCIRLEPHEVHADGEEVEWDGARFWLVYS